MDKGGPSASSFSWSRRSPYTAPAAARRAVAPPPPRGTSCSGSPPGKPGVLFVVARPERGPSGEVDDGVEDAFGSAHSGRRSGDDVGEASGEGRAEGGADTDWAVAETGNRTSPHSTQRAPPRRRQGNVDMGDREVGSPQNDGTEEQHRTVRSVRQSLRHKCGTLVRIAATNHE